jgi:multisubunit Na+/H+ antiporter MnhB subunit
LAFREEHKDRISLVGLLISILILITFLYISWNGTFELTSFSKFSPEFVTSTSGVGMATSKYLWSYRTLDAVVQAILVFAAAAGCITMLRTGKESERT